MHKVPFATYLLLRRCLTPMLRVRLTLFGYDRVIGFQLLVHLVELQCLSSIVFYM